MKNILRFEKGLIFHNILKNRFDMKTSISLFVFFLLFSGCNSNQEQKHKIPKKYKMIVGRWNYVKSIIPFQEKTINEKLFVYWNISFHKNKKYSEKYLVENKLEPKTKSKLSYHIKKDIIFLEKNENYQIIKIDQSQMILFYPPKTKIYFKRISKK